MHLGRFHKSIHDVALHFGKADVPSLLENAASALDRYASTKTAAAAEEFRTLLAEVLAHMEISDEDLYQPYAREIIRDLRLERALPPDLPARIAATVQARGFDHTALSADLRVEAVELRKIISHVLSVDEGMGELGVEWVHVEDAESGGEIGLLIPREAVGETLPALTEEFQQLALLFRAINELTGAQNYDPKVRTISSTDWQVFLDLGPEQILVWVVIVERIVSLFKSNLEIKTLQRSLSEKGMPKKITDLIEKEIEKQVSSSIAGLASDVVSQYSSIDDKPRLNEVETQLRRGLRYLAKRLNQGAQVEINVEVPDDPGEAAAPVDGSPPNELLAKVQAQRAHIAKLRSLRGRAGQASIAASSIKDNPQELLPYLAESEDPPVG
ncbi:MAG: hypothetical protein EON54_10770 [Alcaligenaceae bacterium]|nr:MAG: hypothetical protein EON54_10770 [Alcaligenaceae bacterium]